MRALILTAGLGTRLRPLTDVRAKAAVPVNGETLARRVIRWLVDHGFTDLVLNLHHRPDSIAGDVGDGSDLGARVRYSWEQPVLGSAGGPRRALPLLIDGDTSARQTILLVNGDTLTNVAVRALVEQHERSAAAVTMALIPNPRPDKYGGVLVEGDRVTGFTRPGAAETSFHFIGVQAADARVFADLPDGVPMESVSGVYRELMAREPSAIGAFVADASFQDIGTPADYLDTSLALAGIEGDRLQSPRAQIAATAELRETAVWDDVAIGEGAALTQCVVGDRVRIPDHVRYERCAIVPANRAPQEDEWVEHGLLLRRF